MIIIILNKLKKGTMLMQADEERPSELVARTTRGQWLEVWLPYLIGVPLCVGLIVGIVVSVVRATR